MAYIQEIYLVLQSFIETFTVNGLSNIYSHFITVLFMTYIF